MAVLLLAEVNNGELAMDATAKAVTAAKALGDVTVLAAAWREAPCCHSFHCNLHHPPDSGNQSQQPM